MSESQIQRAILQWLQAKGMLAFRMNVAAVKVDNRFMRFGTPGMADILTFVGEPYPIGGYGPEPLWIEVKAPGGVQSELQKSFQALVKKHGHLYIVARSIDDVEAEIGWR